MSIHRAFTRIRNNSPLYPQIRTRRVSSITNGMRNCLLSLLAFGISTAGRESTCYILHFITTIIELREIGITMIFHQSIKQYPIAP